MTASGKAARQATTRPAGDRAYHEDSPAGRNLNHILALQYLSWAGARMT